MLKRHGIRLGFPLLLLAALGCAGSPPKVANDYALTDSQTMQVPFDEVWQAAKTVLRERGYVLYTRDKRGLFIVYDERGRRFLMPKRRQFTILVEPVDAGSTRVTVETLDQRYGVSLLTFPRWHDHPTEDHSEALAILDAIESKASNEQQARAAAPDDFGRVE